MLRGWASKAYRREQQTPMKLLAWLTETFIATFGITHPRPEQEKAANLIIGGLLLTFLVAVFGVVGFLVFMISTR